MTQDEIIDMWHAANGTKIRGEQYEVVEAFAKLVARHEREVCAKLEIELILSPTFFATMGEYDAHKDAVLAYRNLILARGKA